MISENHQIRKEDKRERKEQRIYKNLKIINKMAIVNPSYQ